VTAAIVAVKPHRAAPAYGRHPWVFAGAVETISGSPKDGDAVELRTGAGAFIAHGLLNRQSKIHVRLYSWDADRPLDEAFFRDRLARAIALRHDVLKLGTGGRAAYRLVFSEADQLSGLTVDRYADFLAVQFTALGLAQRRDMIGRLLMELTGAKGVYLRTEKGIGTLEGLELRDGLLCGELPPHELVIEENCLQFAVSLAEGQKTGYYLDQRDNRAVVGRLAAGRRVLDAFSYSGGFGISAARGGAVEVECVDASEAALKLAYRNAQSNGFAQVTVTQADVFGYLEKLAADGRKFDLIVLDPPKFARNRAAVPKAMQGYRKLHQQALKLLDPNGLLLTCCCTGLVTQPDFEETLVHAATDGRRDVQILERRGPAPDHPVSAACRETGYLKVILARVT